MSKILIILVVVIVVVVLAILLRSRSILGGDEPVYGVLLHGSPRRLDMLNPSPSRVIKNEKAVFGTSSRWLALVFSTPHTSKDLDYGFAKGEPYIAEMRPNAFDILDTPGNVHTISAAGFRTDPRLGLQRHEFIRDEPAQVLEVEHVPNVLAALKLYTGLRLVKDSERPAFFKEKGIPF